ncbi:hypothetical protein ACJRO7_001115 [Eucalyptus globulus]|uniref:C2H2-type domain-containing protein n=1 Tax=Eucalyptus globulus TaxID=34317 RepID=A0ABD3LR31_EUCGL
MKRASDNGVSTMSLDMTNCLMFLLRDINSMPRRIDCNGSAFECKTCQHQPRLSEPKLEDMELRLGSMVTPKMHECSICSIKFANGQALGVHTRKHRGEVSSEVIVNVNLVIPVFRGSNRRVMSLDSNLSPLKNDLKILLGGLTPRLMIHLI